MYLQDCFVEHAPWMGDMRPGTIVRKIMEASGAGTKKESATDCREFDR